jgi:hypothetical protein
MGVHRPGFVISFPTSLLAQLAKLDALGEVDDRSLALRYQPGQKIGFQVGAIGEDDVRLAPWRINEVSSTSSAPTCETISATMLVVATTRSFSSGPSETGLMSTLWPAA